MKTLQQMSRETLKKAQVLTCEEMKNLTGGAIYMCHVEGEFVGWYDGSSQTSVENYVRSLYGGHVSCSLNDMEEPPQ